MSRFVQQALSQESNAKSTGESNSIAAVTLELEQSNVATLEAFHEMEMAEITQEELVGAADRLMAIESSMESAGEQGLTRGAAEGYRHAVYAVVGDAMDQPIASLESFGGDSERVHATQMSLEGIGETIKNVLKAIVDAIKKGIRAVGDFFAKLFGSAEKLQKQLDELNEKTKELAKNDAKPKEDSIKLPNADRLALEGELDLDTITKSKKRVFETLMAFNNEVAEVAATWYKNIASTYKDAEKDEDLEKIREQNEDTIETIKSKMKDIEGTALPGNRMVFFQVEEDEDGNKQLQPPRIDKDPRGKEYDGDGTVDAPDLAWVKEVLYTASTHLKVSDLQKSREDLTKTREDVLEALEAFDRKTSKEDEETMKDKWTATKMRWAMRQANKDFTSAVGRLDNYVFNYARALIGAAKAAMDNMGTKDDGDK